MSRSPERRPCVCHGSIAPADEGDEAIVAAVTEHNHSLDHQAWRYREAAAGRAIPPYQPPFAQRPPVPEVRVLADTGRGGEL